MKLSTILAASLLAYADAASFPSSVSDAIRSITSRARHGKPNFVVILTDDQDYQMGSLDYMPKVQKYLMRQGMTYPNHYCTVALCCPSRVNMWTGKAAHNTNVTDLKLPYGGYEKFVNEGWHKKWLATWMQEAHYNTYFTGKFMNGHSIHNWQKGLRELSLTGHDFMLQPGTYQYLNTTLQRNDEKPIKYPGKYATDLITRRSLHWIDHAAKSRKPFLLMINPVNPHLNMMPGGGSGPPIPAKRHAHLFPGIKVPRVTSFNPDRPSGASWVANLPRLTDLASLDNIYRRRLQALQSVDDMVEATVSRLSELKLLKNTYIIYTSDNGFHLGHHRLAAGKRCPYEEDVNVPLIIRGPGIAKDQVANVVTSHTDIVPSILEWAHAKPRIELDGAVIPGHVASKNLRSKYEHAFIEYWGMASENYHIPKKASINTYKALRVIGSGYNLFYSVWCDGSHEIYDMKNDKYQMNNLYHSKGNLLGVSITKLRHRLDALTLVLKSCKGDVCNHPWKALHPHNQVSSLKEALKPVYDDFYKNQHKVSYHHCPKGYVKRNELPMKYNVFGERAHAPQLLTREEGAALEFLTSTEEEDRNVPYDDFENPEVWG